MINPARRRPWSLSARTISGYLVLSCPGCKGQGAAALSGQSPAGIRGAGVPARRLW